MYFYESENYYTRRVKDGAVLYVPNEHSDSFANWKISGVCPECQRWTIKDRVCTNCGWTPAGKDRG